MSTFIPPSRRETPRKRVRVLQCDLEKMIAYTIDPQRGHWTVDLTVSHGDVTVYPKVGEEWYITKIADVWILDRRSAFQNQSIGVQADQGDRVWYVPDGKIHIQDQDGLLGRSPTGEITMFGGVDAPPGYLLCDGTAVSRETYAALFVVLGTIYGAGDETTTFNVPNLIGSYPIGTIALGLPDVDGTYSSSSLPPTVGVNFIIKT